MSDYYKDLYEMKAAKCDAYIKFHGAVEHLSEFISSAFETESYNVLKIGVEQLEKNVSELNKELEELKNDK